jgi:hypothetical protein
VLKAAATSGSKTGSGRARPLPLLQAGRITFASNDCVNERFRHSLNAPRLSNRYDCSYRRLDGWK